MLSTDREIHQVTIDVDVKDDLPDYYDYIRLQDRGMLYQGLTAFTAATQVKGLQVMKITAGN